MNGSKSSGGGSPNLFKFLAVLIFIPFALFLVFSGLYSISKSMYPLSQYLLWGMAIYTFLYLFLMKMEAVYTVNKTIIDTIFSFSASLKNVSYALSIVVALIPFAFRLINFIPSDTALKAQFFLMGFFYMLHLINACSHLKESLSGNILDYLFGFSMIFIFSFTLFVVFLGLIKNVNVPALYKHSFQLWKDFNLDIIKKLSGLM